MSKVDKYLLVFWFMVLIVLSCIGGWLNVGFNIRLYVLKNLVIWWFVWCMFWVVCRRLMLEVLCLFCVMCYVMSLILFFVMICFWFVVIWFNWDVILMLIIVLSVWDRLVLLRGGIVFLIVWFKFLYSFVVCWMVFM